MADPVIAVPPRRNLEPDVVAVARRLLLPGIELRLVPAEGLAGALRPRRFGNAYANINRVRRGERPRRVVPELADLIR
jgi:hypothetical protein